MQSTRYFLVCIHDVTPRFESETRVLLRDLAPLVGRRLSVGVVPDWHGGWPLAAHRDYCGMVRESADELLLHGYSHRRVRGLGATSVLTGGADEMNGFDAAESQQAIARGQQVFADVFGETAQGFLAPAWQRGRVRGTTLRECGLRHVLGFFTLDSIGGQRVPLATSSWDCGRFGWLGLVGDGLGRALQSITDHAPVLAIHPRDIERGYWPRILRLASDLLRAGFEPVTPAALLHAHARSIDAEVAV